MQLTDETGHSPKPLPNPYMKESQEQKKDYDSSTSSTEFPAKPSRIQQQSDLISTTAREGTLKATVVALEDTLQWIKEEDRKTLWDAKETVEQIKKDQEKFKTEETNLIDRKMSELKSQVDASVAKNKKMLDDALAELSRSRAELETTIADERSFKSQLSSDLRTTITTTGSELTKFLEGELKGPVAQVKAETEALLKDVKEQRKKIKNEGKLQFVVRAALAIGVIAAVFMQVISFFV